MRTTQIVTYGRTVPSGRSDAICSSFASPILASSSVFHPVISGLLAMPPDRSVAEDLLGHCDAKAADAVPVY